MYVIMTDASDYAIGVVLYQDGKPIAFESKKLDSAQCRYTVQEKELFAVIHAFKTWRHYLYRNRYDQIFMITFEEIILMTVILRNTGQELSLEQTPPHPRRNSSTFLTT